MVDPLATDQQNIIDLSFVTLQNLTAGSVVHLASYSQGSLLSVEMSD